MAFKLTVNGFPEQGNIPLRFTCDGEDVSPAISWSGAPPRTKSFALIVDDPDAPGGTWNHWLLWDIPARAYSLRQGERSVGTAGTNDFGKLGYNGPCPPKGGPHRYFFKLFALDTGKLDVSGGAKRPALEKALKRHSIAEANYVGRYARP